MRALAVLASILVVFVSASKAQAIWDEVDDLYIPGLLGTHVSKHTDLIRVDEDCYMDISWKRAWGYPTYDGSATILTKDDAWIKTYCLPFSNRVRPDLMNRFKTSFGGCDEAGTTTDGKLVYFVWFGESMCNVHVLVPTQSNGIDDKFMVYVSVKEGDGL